MKRGFVIESDHDEGEDKNKSKPVLLISDETEVVQDVLVIAHDLLISSESER